MSFAYGGADEAASLRVLHRAVELGVTLIDTPTPTRNWWAAP
ncbi:hypothetical protein [Janthinobacterium sp. DSP2-3-3]